MSRKKRGTVTTKKIQAFLILIFTSVFLWAQDNELGGLNRWESEHSEVWGEPEGPAKKPFRLSNRMVELSLANVSYNATYLNEVFKNPLYIFFHLKNTIEDPNFIWQDNIVIDIDDLFDDFKFFADIYIKPFSLNFNWKDQWGVGLDIGHTYATGNISLSKNITSLSRIEKEKFGIGAAVYTDVGIPIFFHVRDFKVKLRPAVYLPIVYAEPGITYTYKTVTDEDGNEGTRMEAVFDMRVYSAFNMDGDEDITAQYFQDNIGNMLKNNAGYDFGLSVEYPWRDSIDIGLDIVNIPVPYAGARLNHYMQLKGEAYMDTTSIGINDLLDGGDIPEDAYGYPDDSENLAEYLYDSKGKRIYRPFSMLLYLNYRPFDTEIFTLIPSLGFSINRLYLRPAAIEGGLSARLDFANMFITTLGINYNDRKWKNSIDFAFNFRAIELDIGLSMQSFTFKNSWRAAGVGVNAGVKLGW